MSEGLWSPLERIARHRTLLVRWAAAVVVVVSTLVVGRALLPSGDGQHGGETDAAISAEDGDGTLPLDPPDALGPDCLDGGLLAGPFAEILPLLCPADPRSSEWISYEGRIDAGPAWRIEHPRSWSVDESSDGSAFVGLDVDGEVGMVSVTGRAAGISATDHEDPEAYVPEVERSLADAGFTVEVEEAERTQVAGQAGYRFAGPAVVEGYDLDLELRLSIIDGSAWTVLSATTVGAGDDLRRDLDRVEDSFELVGRR